jgi:hypothetical protein
MVNCLVLTGVHGALRRTIVAEAAIKKSGRGRLRGSASDFLIIYWVLFAIVRYHGISRALAVLAATTVILIQRAGVESRLL